MQCEICGKEAKLIKSEIEGAIMEVCSGCAKLGRTLESSTTHQTFGRKNRDVNPDSELIEDFGEVIKTARESIKLNLEDFADKIKEKSSVLKRVEQGSLIPYERLTRKIEKELNISLYARVPADLQVRRPGSKQEITFGDVVKVKIKNHNS